MKPLSVSKVYSAAFDEYRRTGEGLDEAVAMVVAESGERRAALETAPAALGLPASHAKEPFYRDFLSFGELDEAEAEAQAYAAALGHTTQYEFTAKRARKAPERYGGFVTDIGDADIEELIDEAEEDTPPRAPKRHRTSAKKEPEPSAYPAPAPAPAVGQWETAVDPTSRRTYYFNRATGEREWTLPTGAVLKGGRIAAPAPVSPTLAPQIYSPAAVATTASPTPVYTSPAPAMRRPKAGKRINLTKAKKKYRLTDAEVKSLSCEFEINPVDPAFAPMRMCLETELWEMAMGKWGSPTGVAAAQAASAGSDVAGTPPSCRMVP